MSRAAALDLAGGTLWQTHKVILKAGIAKMEGAGTPEVLPE